MVCFFCNDVTDDPSKGVAKASSVMTKANSFALHIESVPLLIRKSRTHLQWRYREDNWRERISYEDRVEENGLFFLLWRRGHTALIVEQSVTRPTY
jgi:hypothetical protein